MQLIWLNWLTSLKAQFLFYPERLDPQLVVDLYGSLAAMPAGQRPTRSVVGMTWGVGEINRQTQPIQDAILKDLQPDAVLGVSDT